MGLILQIEVGFFINGQKLVSLDSVHDNVTKYNSVFCKKQFAHQLENFCQENRGKNTSNLAKTLRVAWGIRNPFTKDRSKQ